MNYSPLKASEIERLKNNVEFVKQAADQVIKDFALFGLEVVFSGSATNAYHELLEQLKEHLEALLKANSSKLYSLLYQIDLNPDKIFGEKVFSLHYLADSILQREFQKVVTRWYFKNQ